MSDEIASAFVQWLKSSGGFVHEGLDLFHATQSRNDRGVFAKRDIKKGEQLLLIPNHATLNFRTKNDISASSMDSIAVLEVLESSEESLTPFLTTVLLLLGELSLGEESGFHPYLQTLPSQAPASLMMWREEDLTLLEGTGLSSNQDRIQFAELYNQKLAPLMQCYPKLWTAEMTTLEDALNIAAIVQSRVFHLNQENWITNEVQEDSTLFLLPGIDMINHTNALESANTELTRIQNEMTVELPNGESTIINGCFTMKAEKDIAEGDEILHSYGALSDADLLRIYGFVSPEEITNPHNVLEVKYSDLKNACLAVLDQQDWTVDSIADREKFLEKHVNPQFLDITFHLKISQFLPDQLITILQVLLLPNEDFTELQEDCSEVEEPELLLGVNYMDESEWSEMVIIALFEVIRLKETGTKSPSKNQESKGEKESLAKSIKMAERDLIQNFKNAVLDLAARQSDDNSDISD